VLLHLASWESLERFVRVQLDHVDAKAKEQGMPTSSDTRDEQNGWCYVSHYERKMAFLEVSLNTASSPSTFV
jgi:hypothetical protein